MIGRTYHPVRREPKKLITPQLSVPTVMCNAKMLPRGMRRSEDNLPEHTAGRYVRCGESSGHGLARCLFASEEY